MRLSFPKIHPRLEPWIDSIWVFESKCGVPETSSRVIAPNGKAKLILSFRNSIHVEHARGRQEGREGGLHFIGVWDESSVVSSPLAASGTIGIEFKPEGVSRFAGFGMRGIANLVCDASETFDGAGRDLEERLRQIPSVESKLLHLQEFLLERMSRTKPAPPILDHVVRRLRETDGALEIRQLEKETGYSRRWLDRLFQEHIGHSPKTLAAIYRFQRFYLAWAQSSSSRFFQEDLLDLYYDQAHFAKEFKRFTGVSPGRYARIDNEFGRLFYRREPG